MYESPTQLCPGVILEKEQVLYDEWYWAQLYGDDVDFYLNTEDTIQRDKYNSISVKETKTPRIIKMRAYPIVMNPTKYQMEKAGIQEQVTVIITTPMKGWTDNGLDDRDISAIRAEVILRGETYTIVDKSLRNQIADAFTSVNIGLFRK